MRRLALLLALIPSPAAAQDWCGAADLNRTEHAICNDSILGDLDAELEAVWQSVARSPAERRDQVQWLRAQRDACGSDIFCIEAAYDDRLETLSGRHAPPASRKRPWCDAGGLNATEATICSDERLADLDAALEAVYGAARASRGDATQNAWLRGERDACGADRACIASAYLRRITELGARLRDR